MSSIAAVWLALAICCEVVATSFLKDAGPDRPLALAAVVLGYGGAFFFLSLCLKQGMPVAVAYAVWSAAGTALITLVGWLVYQQKLSAVALAGLALAVVGVVLLNVGGSNAHGSPDAHGSAGR